ncbi:uncharacterized protein MONBRDRAFT_11461 [Monosiga brevicollis MX1]|uniref:Uncharacterized protein n=1 Tax=Monosiga brevicollis TaxID=81824 RepID=A9V975_MONBE|nr:uncharacterized protein MONBRDRAFT_11461 [Monosiga brevicollis MX1]EDQ85812.1 predicted protein [Monosiga brevicollis MX1]|eukprot:XP_001749291.1 hypothetical protein [Monosiga brevicollis MX1]
MGGHELMGPERVDELLGIQTVSDGFAIVDRACEAIDRTASDASATAHLLARGTQVVEHLTRVLRPTDELSDLDGVVMLLNYLFAVGTDEQKAQLGRLFVDHIATYLPILQRAVEEDGIGPELVTLYSNVIGFLGHDACEDQLNADFVAVMHQYIARSTMGRSPAYLALANLYGPHEHASTDLSGAIDDVMKVLDAAVKNVEYGEREWSIGAPLKAIANLSTADTNKPLLWGNANCMENIAQCLRRSDSEWFGGESAKYLRLARNSGVECLYSMAFNYDVVGRIPDAVALIQRQVNDPANAVDPETRHTLEGALSYIQAKTAKSKLTAAAIPTEPSLATTATPPNQPATSEAPTPLAAPAPAPTPAPGGCGGHPRRRLEQVKESGNCHAEGNYIYDAKKECLFLKVQPGYRPDGWLAMLMSAKLYVEPKPDYEQDQSWLAMVEEQLKLLGVWHAIGGASDGTEPPPPAPSAPAAPTLGPGVDELLAEIRALREQVTRLESQLTTVQGQVETLVEQAEDANDKQQPGKKSRFFGGSK